MPNWWQETGGVLASWPEYRERGLPAAPRVWQLHGQRGDVQAGLRAVVEHQQIITEILQGIRSDKEYDKIKSILSELIYLPITKNMFVHAASIYRAIRKNGKTIRGPTDCVIASICLEHEIELLHNDKDFNTIAQYTSLQIAS
ncbi:MAG: PIN domain-containing protein [Thiobacillaceae bacterium]|nr:PIN domain-containing protein [Thiobacillaceae bacterium]